MPQFKHTKFSAYLLLLAIIVALPFSSSQLIAKTVHLKSGKKLEKVEVKKETEDNIQLIDEDGILIMVDKQKVKKIEEEGDTKGLSPSSGAKNKEAPEFLMRQFMSNDLVVLGKTLYGEKYARRNNTKYTAFSQSWNLATILTMVTPLKNFQVVVMLIDPLVGRTNRDNDFYYQSSPGGADQTGLVARSFYTHQLLYDPNHIRKRRDYNALHDVMINRMIYSWDTKAGRFTSGIYFILGHQITNYALGNFLFGWQAPFLKYLNPTLTSYVRFTSAFNDLYQGAVHTRISFNHKYDIADGFYIMPQIQAGYQFENNTTDRRNGMTDISTRLQFGYNNFFIAFNDIYRPDLAIFDTKYYYPQIGAYPNLSQHDAQTYNPAKVHGLVNQFMVSQIEKQIQNPILREYAVSKYQDMHMIRSIYMINLGYSLQF